jgi:hypothetical protein
MESIITDQPSSQFYILQYYAPTGDKLYRYIIEQYRLFHSIGSNPLWMVSSYICEYQLYFPNEFQLTEDDVDVSRIGYIILIVIISSLVCAAVVYGVVELTRKHKARHKKKDIEPTNSKKKKKYNL